MLRFHSRGESHLTVFLWAVPVRGAVKASGLRLVEPAWPTRGLELAPVA